MGACPSASRNRERGRQCVWDGVSEEAQLGDEIRGNVYLTLGLKVCILESPGDFRPHPGPIKLESVGDEPRHWPF